MAVLQRTIIFVAMCVVTCVAKEQLREMFFWKQLDFKYPDTAARQKAIDDKDFIPENNIPMGIDTWKDKIFVTVPRYKTGVPASLAYIKKTDQRDSPQLIPYPDWASHNLSHLTPGRIVSPFRVQVDSCDRLWILDTGTNDFMGDKQQLSRPQVIVYSLLNDTLLRNYTLPEDQVPEKSFFANIVVDVVDCKASWAYLADLGANGLVVYDWAKNDSWRIEHETFKSDPDSRNYTIGGLDFQFPDGMFGLALGRVHPVTKSRPVFYHPFSSYHEFHVPAHVLRYEGMTMEGENVHMFRDLGWRGPKSQASSSVYDEYSGVLFYTQPNYNAIGCWNSRLNEFSPATQDRIAANNITMIYPNDVKIDSSGHLWVITNKMPVWRFSKLNSTDVNFRLLSGSLQRLTANTKCATKPSGTRQQHQQQQQQYRTNNNNHYIPIPLIIPILGGLGGFGGNKHGYNSGYNSGHGYNTGNGYNTGHGYNTGNMYNPAGNGYNQGNVYNPAGNGYNPGHVNGPAGNGYKPGNVNYPAGNGYNPGHVNNPAGNGYNPGNVYNPAGNGYNPGNVNNPAGNGYNPVGTGHNTGPVNNPPGYGFNVGNGNNPAGTGHNTGPVNNPPGYGFNVGNGNNPVGTGHNTGPVNNPPGYGFNVGNVNNPAGTGHNTGPVNNPPGYGFNVGNGQNTGTVNNPGQTPGFGYNTGNVYNPGNGQKTGTVNNPGIGFNTGNGQNTGNTGHGQNSGHRNNGGQTGTRKKTKNKG